MTDTLTFDQSQTKEEKYSALMPQLEALIHDEPNTIANLANITAALNEVFNYFWIGFYQVDGDELVLGPFQGPIACTRIKFGKGVCGTAWEKMETVIVDDVDSFPGHIACNSESKSEIVVPIIVEGDVRYVLDIDSNELSRFDKIDQLYLEELGRIIANKVG